MPVYFYDPPDRFVAGAVGQPGERIFYLQATSSGRVTSVVLEKFQVSLLAERGRQPGRRPAQPAVAQPAVAEVRVVIGGLWLVVIAARHEHLCPQRGGPAGSRCAGSCRRALAHQVRRIAVGGFGPGNRVLLIVGQSPSPSQFNGKVSVPGRGG